MRTFLLAISLGAALPAAGEIPAVRLAPEKVLYFERYGRYLSEGIVRFSPGVGPEQAAARLKSLGSKALTCEARLGLCRFDAPAKRDLFESLSRVAGLEGVEYVLPVTDIHAVAKSRSPKDFPLEIPGQVGVWFKTLRLSSDAGAVEALVRRAGAVIAWSPRDSSFIVRFDLRLPNRTVIERLMATGEVLEAQSDWIRNGNPHWGDPGAVEEAGP